MKCCRRFEILPLWFIAVLTTDRSLNISQFPAHVSTHCILATTHLLDIFGQKTIPTIRFNTKARRLPYHRIQNKTSTRGCQNTL